MIVMTTTRVKPTIGVAQVGAVVPVIVFEPEVVFMDQLRQQES